MEPTATGEGARGGGTRANAQCGEYRQPERQDDRKRGSRGYDAGKKVKGRKRTILVDTLGLLLKVVVHEADVQDRDGAIWLLLAITGLFPRLVKLWVDGAYRGSFVAWAKEVMGLDIEVVERDKETKGFTLLPRRWVVERTFAWLSNYRRLGKDYEYHFQSSEAMIYAAMVHLMVRRLAAQPQAA
jgi:putative transposase